VPVLLLAATLLTLAAPATHARTYVIPHVLESSGTIQSSQNVFDQTLTAFYGSGLAGTPAGDGAVVQLYLYDNSAGNPMQNNGVDVCNPCYFPLGPPREPRRRTISLEDLLLATGPFAGVKTGFGVIVVDGDAAGVSMESAIVNSHSSAFDVSSLLSAPVRLRSEDPGAPDASVFQITHVLETAGTIANTQNTYDQTIFATYTAGLAGTPAGAGATLDVYLFDSTGNLPMQNGGADVCNPCSFALGGANPRKRSILLDNLISAAPGGPNFGAKVGAAILVVTGDAGNVTLQTVSSNAHTSAFDLTLAYADLAPVQVNELLGVVIQPHPGAVTRLAATPSPSSGEVRFAMELAHATDVELAIFDVTGRKVATLYEGPLQAGASVHHWNGMGPTGAVAGGVYFARLSSRDGSSQARLVMRP
jgi:hypothetical protein